MSLDISLVIISFNSGKFLPGNLQSAIEQEIPFKEIIVVDNYSQDDSVTIVQSYLPENSNLHLIPLSYNSGYAAGANKGIRHGTAQLLMVANADIILEKDFTRQVLDKFRSDPTIDIMSPLLLRFDKKTVDSAGQTYSSALHPHEIGFNRPLEDVDITEKAMFSVCGAATIFQRRALQQLEMDGQYYDEDFFIFWEDFDIGWRGQLLGLRTLFYPRAIVYHFRSATLERNFFSRFSLALARPAFIKFHLVKNRYLTLIKNFRFSQFYTAIPFILLRDFIWTGMLTIVSPKIIISLMKSAGLFKRAFVKRKQLKEKIKEKMKEKG